MPGDGPAGSLARLVAGGAPPGTVVLDLGSGDEELAAPVDAAGFTWVGCRPDAASAAALVARGREAHSVDPAATDVLAARLAEVAGDRRVGALVVAEVLTGTDDLDALLDALEAASSALGGPLLVVAVANVGHVDVAAKLATGRWDATSTGLLAGACHHFTGARLDAELARRGWAPVARDDVAVERSDQHFPPDHPGLVPGAPLRELLAAVRRRSGDEADATWLVRSYRPGPRPSTDPAPDPRPFLAAVVRTQGRRLANLGEALTCLAAQTDPDFTVLLCVHTGDGPDEAAVDGVRGLVHAFAPAFARRVEVLVVEGGGRARPLNAGLASARARYVAFLDDDDLVTADWVERFRAGADAAPGRVVRSITVDRRVRRSGGAPGDPPYETVSGLEATHAARFDVLEHFSRNRTPICSFAVPLDAVGALRTRFDENLVVLEDWKFLLESALVSGVADTGHVTSVYHRWEDEGSTARAVDTATWEDTHRAVVGSFDAGPLLLPPSCAGRIALMYEKAAILDHEMPIHNVERADLAARLAEAERVIGERDDQLAERDRRIAGAGDRIGELDRELAQMRASRAWRLTEPVRRVAAAARRRRVT